jgi:hypothetical protein
MPRTASARLSSDSNCRTGVSRLARRSGLRDNAARFEVSGIGPEGPVEKINLQPDALLSVQQVARVGRTSRAMNRKLACDAVEANDRDAMQSQAAQRPG